MNIQVDVEALERMVDSFASKDMSPLVKKALILSLQPDQAGQDAVLVECSKEANPYLISEVIQAVLRSNPAEADVFAEKALGIFVPENRLGTQQFCYGVALGILSSATSTQYFENTRFQNQFRDYIVRIILARHPLLGGLEKRLQVNIIDAVRAYADSPPSSQVVIQDIIDTVAIRLERRRQVELTVLGQVILDAFFYIRAKSFTVTRRARLIARRPEIFIFQHATGATAVVHRNAELALASLQANPVLHASMGYLNQAPCSMDISLGAHFEIKG